MSALSHPRPVTLKIGVTLVALMLSPVLRADGPSWWQSRGVMDPTQTKNDFAAMNVGQLKNLATCADQELQAHLPGGSSATIAAMIGDFSTITPDRNDYSAVNVGQLKNVAKPFYDRLIQAGYCTTYPWSDTDPARNDFAQVNVGQAKFLFSFDLTLDADNDGLPDWWEMAKFGHLGVDPNGNSQPGGGDGLTNLEAYWLGINPNSPAQMTNTSALGLVVYTDLQ